MLLLNEFKKAKRNKMKKLTLSVAILVMAILVSCGSEKENYKPTNEEVALAIEKAGEVVEAEKTMKEVVVVEETEVTPATEGKKIFEGKGACMACHQPEIKVIGPSLKEIATIYKEKNADMVKFLKDEGEAIVDPSQFAVMQANFAITKQMTDEELKSLEAYIYSFL